MEATIADRKQAALARRDELARNRGAAVLDGGDTAEIARQLAATEAEIAGLDAAEAEALSRERAALDDAHAASQSRHRAAIRQHETDRLAALEDAEQRCRQMVAALFEFFRCSAEIAKGAGALGIRPPGPLNRGEMERRVSRQIIEAMKPICRPGQMFGDFEWGSGLPLRDARWRDTEERFSARQIADLARNPTN